MPDRPRVALLHEEWHPSMEVLRWFAFFVVAILLMVAAMFWLMGRPLPFPSF